MAEAAAGAVVVPRTDDAAARQAELVNRGRAELLWSGSAVTIGQIARATGKKPDTVSKMIQRHRDAGRVVTVIHDRTTYVPTFQLDEAFSVEVGAAEIVSRLTDAGMSAWALWRWAVTPNSWLHGDTPAERLAADDLDAVRAAVAGLLQTDET